ncbi:MAG: hypothetical protein ACK4N5_17410, partial [Myxococcales bacterium]
MLALRCPHCRAAAPIALASPELLHCDACGQRSETPAHARQQLATAAKLLRHSEASARKLSKAQQEALLQAQT